MNTLHSPETHLPRPAAALPVLALLCSCATERSFEMTGGPAQEKVAITESDFPEALEPHLADAPKALALYKERESDVEAASNLRIASLVVGLANAGFATALLIRESDNGPSASFVDVGILIGGLSASLLLRVIARIIEPGQDDWAEVFRAYNEERPEAAWSVPFFGVAPTAAPNTNADPGLAIR